MDQEEVRRSAARENIKLILETPVIAVAGMGKNCCKLEIQQVLYRVLKEKGYRPAWISSNPLGILQGGYSMPDFFFSDKLSLEKKILALNHYLFAYERTKKPDVFLIGVPEGITEFESHEYNHFAEYSLVVCNAVHVDSAVLCTYFMKVDQADGIWNLVQYCRQRFRVSCRCCLYRQKFF